MNLNQLSFYKTIFLTFNLFACSLIFAQSEDTTKAIIDQYKLSPGFPNIEFQSTIFGSQNFVPSGFSSSNLNQFYFSTPKSLMFDKLSFRQSKTANIFLNLGAYEHYNNSLKYNAGSKLKLILDFGLLKQNSIVTANQPNFQFTLGTSVEYNINPWLSLYGYGHYLLPSLSQSNLFFDPLIYMDPIFFQTEIGGGARAKYKNIKADVGLKKIFDTQFKQSNPINSMNTKISIGF